MLLAVAGSAAAQDVKFEFHGFVGASVYNENAALSGAGGQAAWYVDAEPLVDEEAFGGDVRQTRLNFSLTGPALWEGVAARGFAEIDFFGGATAGGFGDISLAPRLRVAFAELKLTKTGTMIRAGQDHDLTLGILLPTTVGHVAFPLSYTAGTIGWRRPQLAVYQTVPVADMKLEFAAAIGRSGWNAANTGLGVASGLPSFEGRAKLSGKVFEAFVAGHWSQIDASGYGSEPAQDAEADTTVVTAGGKVSMFNATLQGAAYTGTNLGPLAGNLIQWQSTAVLLQPGGADVSEIGAWLQAGYNFNPNWSAWLLHGFANPDDEDLATAGLARGRNQTTSALVRFQQKGYTAGVEYTMFRTRYLGAADPLEGSQFMLSGMYFF
jgi:hypothetical protein